MKRKAIIIGVDEYKDPNITNLKYAISDANRLAGLLTHLPDGGGFEVDFLPNPSDGEVTDALESVVSEISAGDLLFFYFAGHGIQPEGSKQHLLLCRNAHRKILHGHGTNGSVPHTFLSDLAKSCRADMVFCFDACRTSPQNDRSDTAQMTGSAALRDIGVGNAPTLRGACFTLLSCSDGESAEENADLRGGIFTASLVGQMKACLEASRSIVFNGAFLQSVASQMQRHRTFGTQTPIFHAPMGREFTLFRGTKYSAPAPAPAPVPVVEVPPPPPVYSPPVVVSASPPQPIPKTSQPLPVVGIAIALILVMIAASLFIGGGKQGRSERVEEFERYLKAAEQGDEVAIIHIGYSYLNGDGVSPDEVEAVRWFRKLADKEYSIGQRLLGQHYEKGIGVPKDEAEAIKWYRKAAEQGDEKAKKALERLSSP